MINNPGKTFSREDIGQLINLDKERSIDVIITRLRKKIEIDPKNPKFLQTIRGAGYVLWICLLDTSPSPRDVEESRMPSAA